MKKLVFILSFISLILLSFIVVNKYNTKEKINKIRDNILSGKIIKIKNNTHIDLDNDGEKELISYKNIFGNELSYSLSVGEFSINVDGYNVKDDDIYIAKLQGILSKNDNIQIIIKQSDQGEYNFYSVYYYDKECIDTISSIGNLELLPYKIEDFSFNALANGNVLEQKIEQEYRIASGSIDNNIIRSLYKVPKETYPIGIIVRIKIPINIYGTQDISNIVETVQVDKKVILCATNNYNWLYIKYFDDDIYGWIPLLEESSSIIINGENYPLQDVFKDIHLTDY